MITGEGIWYQIIWHELIIVGYFLYGTLSIGILYHSLTPGGQSIQPKGPWIHRAEGLQQNQFGASQKRLPPHKCWILPQRPWRHFWSCPMTCPGIIGLGRLMGRAMWWATLLETLFVMTNKLKSRIGIVGRVLDHQFLCPSSEAERFLK